MLKVTELDGTRHRISTNSRLAVGDPNETQKEWGAGAVVRIEGYLTILVRESLEDIERQLGMESSSGRKPPTCDLCGGTGIQHNGTPGLDKDLTWDICQCRKKGLEAVSIVSGVGGLYEGEEVCTACEGRGLVSIMKGSDELSQAVCGVCRGHGKVREV